MDGTHEARAMFTTATAKRRASGLGKPDSMATVSSVGRCSPEPNPFCARVDRKA